MSLLCPSLVLVALASFAAAIPPITERTGELTNSDVTTSPSTFPFENTPGIQGHQAYRLLFERFDMPDCSVCSLMVNTTDGPGHVFCDDNLPSVMTVNANDFLITVMGSCDFSMAWRQFPIEDSCCGIVTLASDNLPPEYTGNFVKLSMPVNEHAAYYGEAEGDFGEKSVLSFAVSGWKLSSNKYMLPGNDLAPFTLMPESAQCAEGLTSYMTFNPIAPDVPVAGNPISLSCLSKCMGPAPMGPVDALVIASFDTTDANAEVDVGTIVTYQCSNGVNKFAICDGNGEWTHEDLSQCTTSGPVPMLPPVDPLPPRDGCMYVEANLGQAVIVNDTECFFIKSHRKYSVAPYPPKKMSDEWLFAISPDCQNMIVEFEPTFFGIDGDANTGCLFGDKLQVYDDRKKGQTLINICGQEVPKNLRLKKKNRTKVFKWDAIPTFGNEDGFLAYITVKGCEVPITPA